MDETTTKPKLEASDEAAFRTVLAHRGMLRRYVAAIIKRHDLVEDVFEDVMLKIVRAWKSYDPGRPFGPWARCITKRVCLDVLRRQQREPVLLDDAVIEQLVTDPDSRSEHELEERKEALRACMQKLSQANKQLLVYRHYQRLPNLEIARIVGKSRQALYAAFSRLHGCLGECVERTLRAL